MRISPWRARRTARLALAGAGAAVLALAACSARPATTALAPAGPPAAGPPGPGSPTPPMTVLPGQPGMPPKLKDTLSPAQLTTAYDLGPLFSRGITGTGQTVVIVVPFGSPLAEQDLAAFDQGWHLPPPPSFRVIAPAGPIPPFQRTSERIGAAVAATLDVE